MELISNRELHKPSIYLISPTKVDNKTFPSLLESVLSSGLISVFQLRVKEYSDMETIQIIEKLLPQRSPRKIIQNAARSSISNLKG